MKDNQPHYQQQQNSVPPYYGHYNETLWCFFAGSIVWSTASYVFGRSFYFMASAIQEKLNQLDNYASCKRLILDVAYDYAPNILLSREFVSLGFNMMKSARYAAMPLEVLSIGIKENLPGGLEKINSV